MNLLIKKNKKKNKMKKILSFTKKKKTPLQF